MKQKGDSTDIQTGTASQMRRAPLWKRVWNEKVLYLILLPTMLYFIFFKVLPIINMRLAFYSFNARGPWRFSGLHYFEMIFSSPAFFNILKNTLIISFMKYILLFPFFLIFAIMLTQVRSWGFRKYVQVISYLPHFLSWVVIAGIWIDALSIQGGVNELLGLFGIEAHDFMTDRSVIRWILMICEGWRSIGWDSIIYYTAIISISPSLFEAADMDGANTFQKIWHVVLPALITPAVTMFILNLGFFLSAGFDQVLNFSNTAVESTIDILDTYIYRIGIQGGQYSLATAVSLIKGVVGMILVLATHLVSKRLTGEGVW